MNTPRYTVTVTSLTRGWSQTMSHGYTPTGNEPVLLLDPFRYRWAFKGGVVPAAYMAPVEATIGLMAKTAAVAPEVARGDLLQLDVRVGNTGKRIVAPAGLRVSDAKVVASGDERYAVDVVIEVTDLTVDWAALSPGQPLGCTHGSGSGHSTAARHRWRDRMAEIGARIGLAIGCPTSWVEATSNVNSSYPANGEGPHENVGGVDHGLFYPGGGFTYDGTAEQLLESLIDSHQPGGLTHTWATVYAPGGYPAGYRKVGPDVFYDGHPGGTIADPGTAHKLLAVPASRKTYGPLPLLLQQVAGVVTLVPRPPTAGAQTTMIGLDASHCELPATARRGREYDIDRAIVQGQLTYDTGGVGTGPYATEPATRLVDSTLDPSRGVSAREVPTQLRLESAANADTAGRNFLTADTALAEGWAYDSLQLVASDYDDTTAAWLLPLLPARPPGETDSDGVLLRHVVLYGLDNELRFSGQPPAGYVVGGELAITDGQLVFTLQLAPGGPPVTDADRYQVGDYTAEAWAASSWGSGVLDPSVTWGELAYVGRPSTVPSTVTANV